MPDELPFPDAQKLTAFMEEVLLAGDADPAVRNSILERAEASLDTSTFMGRYLHAQIRIAVGDTEAGAAQLVELLEAAPSPEARMTVERDLQALIGQPSTDTSVHELIVRQIDEAQGTLLDLASNLARSGWPEPTCDALALYVRLEGILRSQEEDVGFPRHAGLKRLVLDMARASSIPWPTAFYRVGFYHFHDLVRLVLKEAELSASERDVLAKALETLRAQQTAGGDGEVSTT